MHLVQRNEMKRMKLNRPINHPLTPTRPDWRDQEGLRDDRIGYVCGAQRRRMTAGIKIALISL